MECMKQIIFYIYRSMIEILNAFVVETHEGNEVELRKALNTVRKAEIAKRKAEKDDKTTFTENQKKPEWIANNWHKFVSDEEANKIAYPWCFIKDGDNSYTYIGGYDAVQSINDREQIENIFGGCSKK